MNNAYDERLRSYKYTGLLETYYFRWTSMYSWPLNSATTDRRLERFLGFEDDYKPTGKQEQIVKEREEKHPVASAVARRKRKLFVRFINTHRYRRVYIYIYLFLYVQ